MSGAKDATRASHVELGEKLEAMLAALYKPERTATGAVAKSKGLPRYSDDDLRLFCARYLGISATSKTLLNIRKANEKHRATFVASYVKRAVARFEAGEDVQYLVRKDKFVAFAKSSLFHFAKFGAAHDGGGLVSALERYAVKLGAVDVVLLEQARALESETHLEAVCFGDEVDYPEYRSRLEQFETIPLELRAYVLEDGRFIFGDDTFTDERAKRVLAAAFEAKLCRLES